MMMTMTTYFIPKLDSMSRIDVTGSQVPQVDPGNDDDDDDLNDFGRESNKH